MKQDEIKKCEEYARQRFEDMKSGFLIKQAKERLFKYFDDNKIEYFDVKFSFRTCNYLLTAYVFALTFKVLEKPNELLPRPGFVTYTIGYKDDMYVLVMSSDSFMSEHRCANVAAIANRFLLPNRYSNWYYYFDKDGEYIGPENN